MTMTALTAMFVLLFAICCVLFGLALYGSIFIDTLDDMLVILLISVVLLYAAIIVARILLSAG